MNPIIFLSNSFPTGSIVTKENALVLVGVIAEISLISLLVFSQLSIFFIAVSLIFTNCSKIIFVARKFKKKEEAELDLQKKVQQKDYEIFQLKKEVEALKAPKAD
jgi:hypothetical protein